MPSIASIAHPYPCNAVWLLGGAAVFSLRPCVREWVLLYIVWDFRDSYFLDYVIHHFSLSGGREHWKMPSEFPKSLRWPLQMSWFVRPSVRNPIYYYIHSDIVGKKAPNTHFWSLDWRLFSISAWKKKRFKQWIHHQNTCGFIFCPSVHWWIV